MFNKLSKNTLLALAAVVGYAGGRAIEYGVKKVMEKKPEAKKEETKEEAKKEEKKEEKKAANA